MSATTKIQWASMTGSPWLGCSVVSPGCTNCYAKDLAETRLAHIFRHAYRKAGFADWETRPVWGEKATRVLSRGFWSNAIAWNKKAAGAGERPRMFPSMDDFLDEMPAGIIDQDGKTLQPIAVLADILALICGTPNLDWLLLTKRPENWQVRMRDALECLKERDIEHSKLGNWYFLRVPLPNVWFGVSVEDQQRADERIPELLKIPAKVRFLSVEPMLGPIDLSDGFWRSGCDPNCGDKCSKDADCPMNLRSEIHWSIFGGESGPKARRCDIQWIREGVRQCREAGVAPWVKQLGSFCVTDEATPDGWPAGTELVAGCMDEKLVSLKDKKGGDPCEWPEDLRIREFPK